MHTFSFLRKETFFYGTFNRNFGLLAKYFGKCLAADSDPMY